MTIAELVHELLNLDVEPEAIVHVMSMDGEYRGPVRVIATRRYAVFLHVAEDVEDASVGAERVIS